MNERSIFLEALDQTDPTQRAAYLDKACAGEAALRQRVEALLRSHAEAGGFLDKLAPERVAEELGKQQVGEETQGVSPGNDKAGEDLGFLTPADKPDVLGRLGHYDILEVVGRGGMGVVLRAFDEELHRVVAIKVMAQQLATSATARKRFKREAQAAAAVSHDHVVTIHGVGEAGGLPYLVMQHVAGLSLQQRLERDGPLELQEVLRIGMQTASGLAAAHAQGLVHRDIKPANILLENGVERVKITDFGLARAAADASLTQSGMVAGTPQYMSPEQAEGKAVDSRTDLFSLASVLYAICTGRAPFRASGTMAVLKRVCEETPTPIRETNPAIPEWLVQIIDKLHAKDPSQRYQSATEVAELLGRHLAQVQHPSVVGQVANEPPEPKAGSRPSTRRRLAIAAAGLVCLVAGLSLTEAAGVTSLRATVIRIFTPEGTLVVETDDPAVKVVVEGDGDLVITGAGPQEVRLRAGSYRLKATKDGRPVKLDRDLVNITRHDRQIVRVRLEGDAPGAVVRKAERGAFVLLGGKGVAERKFDTLAEAVAGANDGDTIEIRGNGPFVTEPITLSRTALTIRAGAGFRPVIKPDQTENQKFRALLQTDSPLVLEGLEIQRMGTEPVKRDDWWAIIYSDNAPLYAANCRFMARNLNNGISAASPTCQLRNCELLSGDNLAVVWSAYRSNWRLLIDNCVHTASKILVVSDAQIAKDHASVRLTRSTFLTSDVTVRFQFIFDEWQRLLKANKGAKFLRVEASGNVLDARTLLADACPDRDVPDDEAKALLAAGVAWQGQRNLYAVRGPYLSVSPRGAIGLRPNETVKNLADWKRFWGTADADSTVGVVRYHGGNLIAKLRNTPERLAPEDFRLRSDSAGYRAGKDGKDLGADVDLVGPGPAYERWKQTPDYQQWLKDTGQLRAEAPKAEHGVFVVLSGKGFEVGKFDTLAEAVQSASGGDTVEVRGNGPFLSDTVDIRQSLVIRAGAGYVPSITLSKAMAERNCPLLNISAPLVLEGLELRQTGGVPEEVAGHLPFLLAAGHQGPLYIANCRLIFKGAPYNGWPFHAAVKSLSVRNSVLTGNVDGTSWMYGSGGRCTIENCVSVAGGIGFSNAGPDVKDVTIRVRGNTVVGNCLTLVTFGKLNLPNAAGATPPVHLEVSENVARWDVDTRNKGFLWLRQLSLKEPASGPEAEEFLRRLVGLDEKQNLYQSGTPMLRLHEGKRGQDLVDWDRFWGQMKTGSVEGDIRFQGGDLMLRSRSAPELITAEDFRLRPDSAGYRAGKDGKDLGADIDLVGPGAAYERWKKTPDYQKWLKETGQK